MTVDVTQTRPSLIDCLGPEGSRIWLDSDVSGQSPTDSHTSALHLHPFSKTLAAAVKTDTGDVVQNVHLIIQRDRYDTRGSMAAVTNRTVDAAWQRAFDFHRGNAHAKAPIVFNSQVGSQGELQPFRSLFRCRRSGKWFHPVCPRCLAPLSLCRDDALLAQSGLPTYTDSLERFLYCRACAAQSGGSPFYIREKISGLPETVLDAQDLTAQWKQVFADSTGQSIVPCRQCRALAECFGPESPTSGTIVPFAFYPFYMLIFPAPSLNAADFMAMLAGGPAGEARTDGAGVPHIEPDRYLFEGGNRQFLEILYLKLTFLAQVCRQYLATDGKGGPQEYDLSLEGIGVDLYPPGAGLPAFWNFRARILDAVGAFQLTPFAPIIPEAPRLHFLGALWFRTLLVNARQKADAVFAEVGRRVGRWQIENGADNLEMDAVDAGGVFACSQVFWEPGRSDPPEAWQTFWRQAVHLGFQLVHAGLKAGVSWDNARFLAGLEVLRKQIKNEMFSGTDAAAIGRTDSQGSARMRRVLGGILEKWAAEAAAVADRGEPESASPPVDAGRSDWEQDNMETVVTSVGDERAPIAPVSPGAPESSQPASPWAEDLDATLVLGPEADNPTSKTTPPGDDLEATVVISPTADHSAPAPPEKEADLPETAIQGGDAEEELEPTVVLKAEKASAPQQAAPSEDEEIMEQTVIIRSEVKKEKE